MTDRVDISRLLVEMRSLKAQTQAFPRPNDLSVRDVADVKGLDRGVKVSSASDVPSFGDMLAQAVDKVNNIQQSAGAMSAAYEKGDPTIDISDVMIASQKASVAFQSMVQVRNKVMDAYRDVMNMPL